MKRLQSQFQTLTAEGVRPEIARISQNTEIAHKATTSRIELERDWQISERRHSPTPPNRIKRKLVVTVVTRLAPAVVRNPRKLTEPRLKGSRNSYRNKDGMTQQSD